jgi:hypothetical protein
MDDAGLQRSKNFAVRAALSVRRRGRLGCRRCARGRRGGGDRLLAAILPALPMVLVQALLLDRSYSTQYRAALAT